MSKKLDKNLYFNKATKAEKLRFFKDFSHLSKFY